MQPDVGVFFPSLSEPGAPGAELERFNWAGRSLRQSLFALSVFLWLPLFPAPWGGLRGLRVEDCGKRAVQYAPGWAEYSEKSETQSLLLLLVPAPWGRQELNGKAISFPSFQGVAESFLCSLSWCRSQSLKKRALLIRDKRGPAIGIGTLCRCCWRVLSEEITWDNFI